MNNIIRAIIWSSTNPNKISASIKGMAATLVSVLVLLNIHVDITPVVDQVILIVNLAAVFASAVYALVGLTRKLYLTIIGQNQSLQ